MDLLLYWQFQLSKVLVIDKYSLWEVVLRKSISILFWLKLQIRNVHSDIFPLNLPLKVNVSTEASYEKERIYKL